MITFGQNDKLQLIASSNADLDIHCTYSDLLTVTSGDLPQTKAIAGAQFTKITVSGTADSIDTPDGAINRTIQRISVINLDGSVSNTVYVAINRSGTAYRITPDVALLAGEMYQYEHRQGWRKVSSQGKLYN